MKDQCSGPLSHPQICNALRLVAFNAVIVLMSAIELVFGNFDSNI